MARDSSNRDRVISIKKCVVQVGCAAALFFLCHDVEFLRFCGMWGGLEEVIEMDRTR